MRHFLPAIGATLSLFALSTLQTPAQTTPNVVGSGAVSAANTHARIMATVGQSGIGVVTSATAEASQGFWHARMSASSSVASEETAQGSHLTLTSAPNPVTHSTVLSFALPEPSRVSITLYDAVGRELRTLTDREYEAGSVSVEFDLSEFPSGRYTAFLRAGDYTGSTGLLLID